MRTLCKTQAGKALERAEKIKNLKKDLEPIATNHFSEREGLLYPLCGVAVVSDVPSQHRSTLSLRDLQLSTTRKCPWSTRLIHRAPFASLRSRTRQLIQYSRTSVRQPPLSAEQRLHGAIWSKPVFPEQSNADDLLPEDIVQHIVSDCSVCASIAVCIDHHRRFQSQVSFARSSSVT